MSETHDFPPKHRGKGWGFILNSRKWHFYEDGRSLCGRYMKFTSHDLELGNDLSSSNCAACRKIVLKRASPTK